MKKNPPIRYVRVSFFEKKKPVILRVVSETDVFLRGVEVNKYGEETSGKDFDVRMHVISLDAIKKLVEMRMNNTYAELEAV